MSKGGRKGRVSNELVAASCAAILAVYAAGYWRTRDEARRFETEAQARRPARSPPAVAVVPPRAPPAAATPPEVPEKAQGAAAPRAAAVAMGPAEKHRPVDAATAVSPVVTMAAGPPPSAQVPVVAPAQIPPAEVVATVAAEPAPPPGVIWHDGVYTGWGQSFHGDIEARVVIRDGRIRTSEIATCATRYPCYVIETIFNQPVDRQSADVDRVSRATESTDAYSDAVWQALQKAEAGPGTPSGTAASSP